MDNLLNNTRTIMIAPLKPIVKSEYQNRNGCQHRHCKCALHLNKIETREIQNWFVSVANFSLFILFEGISKCLEWSFCKSSANKCTYIYSKSFEVA